MLQRHSTFTITQLFTHIVHDFRHGFPQLLAYDLCVKFLGFALLEPFSTWLFTALISTTERLSISNTQLLTFFLAPMGLLTLLLSGTTTLAVLFIELVRDDESGGRGGPRNGARGHSADGG